MWRAIITKLAESGYQVFAPDLPGYGFTRLPEDGDFSLAGAVDILAGWLICEKIAPVWLVGHDIGGGIAQILTTSYPDLVELLTLGDTLVADSWPVTAIKLFQVIAKLGLYPITAAAHLVPNPYAWYALCQAFADPGRLTPEIANRVFWEEKVKDRRGREEFAQHLKALNPDQTIVVAELLKDIEIPTLLIWRKEDRFQPWETVGQKLKSLLPDPDVVVIEDAGHFLPIEKPDDYVQAMLSWRRSLRI